MFNKQNFCHIASNNRNDVKAGVFVYKTTDDLATVSVSGYFNDKIVDINLHDLIIHEWHDATDRTKVERNVLCVTERTLDNVGTAVIKSKWEGDIEQDIADIEQEIIDLANIYVKQDGTSVMSAPLKFKAGSLRGAIGPSFGGVELYTLNNDDTLSLVPVARITNSAFTPHTDNAQDVGSTTRKWKDAYIARVITAIINNGFDIAVPVTNQADTLALKSQVDLAANSGRMITDEGVWYAKMDAAGTIPAEAEVEGRNYADFTQVDVDNNPIIVIYTYTSGAWTQTETITPPAEYDGYVPVTSKIWDIQEQAGQQGGRILWNHQSKDFTPYPVIISFEDAHLTGDSTVVMPLTPSGTSIVNVDYLSNHTGSGKNVGDVFFTMRTDNELSGAVECNGATYNTEDFIGTGTISGLLAAGKIPYVSLATYATVLSTQGSCGVFGWDGAGTTAFRVPSLNDIFVETGTAAQIGDYIAPGLPDHTHQYEGVNLSNTHTESGSSGKNPTTTTKTSGLASVSNTIYGNSNTVQPNTVRYRAMVQLATGATDEALETCTGVLADVAALKYDYVTEFQEPTAQNNYTWYRKYRSGWVEQGGYSASTGSWGTTTINLPVQMRDVYYTLTIGGDGTSADFTNNATATVRGCSRSSVTARTTTSFQCQSNNIVTWEVKGMYAQP